ncbi:hypothetical protein QBC42DRAFT_338692 [Cladorrhinum samala]|uniref:DUF7702 domain-containing protein n=1 Tax=Cladorrhinum samala TaxID=585594 RepID=A0AAV9HNK4_9PEZI|nr:hypothetical protein QBC42DRAFT_338692 [Cladorrhinum samala]
MTLSTINSIAAAQLAIYVPLFLISILLAYRHGFRRNAGWLYIVIFSLTRVVASSLQLSTASMKSPPSVGLVVATQVFYSVGVSTLVLALLNLLGRVLESANAAATNTLFKSQHQRLAQFVVFVGLVLGIVGGSMLGGKIEDVMSGKTAQVSTPWESKAGLGLILAGFVAAALGAIACALQFGSVRHEKGERRLLWTLVAVLPFMLVRIVFSCLGTFGSDAKFRSFGRSSSYPWLFLGMAVIMEIIVVVLLEAVGLTLKKKEKKGGTHAAGLSVRRRCTKSSVGCRSDCQE